MIRCRSGALYTGITIDIARRFSQHHKGVRAGGAKFFASDPPEEILFQEAHPNRASATAREYQIKKMKRADKLRLILAQSAT